MTPRKPKADAAPAASPVALTPPALLPIDAVAHRLSTSRAVVSTYGGDPRYKAFFHPIIRAYWAAEQVDLLLAVLIGGMAPEEAAAEWERVRARYRDLARASSRPDGQLLAVASTIARALAEHAVPPPPRRPPLFPSSPSGARRRDLPPAGRSVPAGVLSPAPRPGKEREVD